LALLTNEFNQEDCVAKILEFLAVAGR